MIINEVLFWLLLIQIKFGFSSWLILYKDYVIKIFNDISSNFLKIYHVFSHIFWQIIIFRSTAYIETWLILNIIS